jgi:hypothetical protein
MIRNFICAFLEGYYSVESHKEKHAREQKCRINNLTERQVDKTVEDSFPASDPPSTY